MRFFLPGEQAGELSLLVQGAQSPHEPGGGNGYRRPDLGAIREPRLGAAQHPPGRKQRREERRLEQQHWQGLRDHRRFLLRAFSFPSLTYRTAASASSRSAPRGTLSRAVFAIMVGTCGGLSGTLQARSSLRAETMTVSACGSRRLMWGMDMGGEE